jgi:hypothetical protein
VSTDAVTDEATVPCCNEPVVLREQEGRRDSFACSSDGANTLRRRQSTSVVTRHRTCCHSNETVNSEGRAWQPEARSTQIPSNTRFQSSAAAHCQPRRPSRTAGIPDPIQSRSSRCGAGAARVILSSGTNSVQLGILQAACPPLNFMVPAVKKLANCRQEHG